MQKLLQGELFHLVDRMGVVEVPDCRIMRC